MLGTGAGLDDSKIDDIINEVDKNGDGVLTEDEMRRMKKHGEGKCGEGKCGEGKCGGAA